MSGGDCGGSGGEDGGDGGFAGGGGFGGDDIGAAPGAYGGGDGGHVVSSSQFSLHASSQLKMPNGVHPLRRRMSQEPSHDVG